MKAWLAYWSVARWHRKLGRALRRFDAACKRLEIRRGRLERLARRVESEVAAADLEIKGAEERHRELINAMEGLREENRIYKELVVPLMTQEYQRLLARYDHLTAIEVRGQVASRPAE